MNICHRINFLKINLIFSRSNMRATKIFASSIFVFSSIRNPCKRIKGSVPPTTSDPSCKNAYMEWWYMCRFVPAVQYIQNDQEIKQRRNTTVVCLFCENVSVFPSPVWGMLGVWAFFLAAPALLSSPSPTNQPTSNQQWLSLTSDRS